MSTRRILKKDEVPAHPRVVRSQALQLPPGAPAGVSQAGGHGGPRVQYTALHRLLDVLCCCCAQPRRSSETVVRVPQTSALTRIRSHDVKAAAFETEFLYDSAESGHSSDEGPIAARRDDKPSGNRREWSYSDTSSTSSSTSSLRSTSYFRSEESVSSTNSRYSSTIYSEEKSCTSSVHTSSMNASNGGTYWSPQRQRRRKTAQKRYSRSRGSLQDFSRSSSSCSSSMTDSTMSLNVITVTLNTDARNFLGITLVGHSGSSGDGGIYVGSVMKGGAVEKDGRIEGGDMILEVNGQSFEHLSNDEAVRLLREAVRKPGPVTLVVAKCWEAAPLMTGTAREAEGRNAFLTPRQEPVRPIDPFAWVAHTTALQKESVPPAGRLQPLPAAASGSRSYAAHGDGSMDSASTRSSADATLLPDAAYGASMRLSPASAAGRLDMAAVVASMARPDSGLDVRDRTWLKVTIPSAFIGSDLVDWLLTRLRVFTDRGDACNYAAGLLKSGYIQHTVNKEVFSEQCYYVFSNSKQNRAQTDSARSYSNQITSASPLKAPPETGNIALGRRQQPQQPHAITSLKAGTSQGTSLRNSRDLTPRGGQVASTGRATLGEAKPYRLPLPLARPVKASPAELSSSRASFHAAMENPLDDSTGDSGQSMLH